MSGSRASSSTSASVTSATGSAPRPSAGAFLESLFGALDVSAFSAASLAFCSATNLIPILLPLLLRIEEEILARAHLDAVERQLALLVMRQEVLEVQALALEMLEHVLELGELLEQVAQAVGGELGALAVARIEGRDLDGVAAFVEQPLLHLVVVVDVHLGLALLDLVERRLGDVDVPLVDERLHLAVEEREQQRADVLPSTSASVMMMILS